MGVFPEPGHARKVVVRLIEDGWRRRGFTLAETLMVLAIIAIGLSIASIAFGSARERAAARNAARVFTRDLARARAFAVRGRESVVVSFREDDPENLGYTVTSAAGRVIVDRRFVEGEDIVLTSIDLAVAGDSFAFDRSGTVRLRDTDDGLGTALFRSGGTAYAVRFNATGAARLEVR